MYSFLFLILIYHSSYTGISLKVTEKSIRISIKNPNRAKEHKDGNEDGRGGYLIDIPMTLPHVAAIAPGRLTVLFSLVSDMIETPLDGG